MANPLSRTEMESNEGSVLCEPKRSSCFAMNLVFFHNFVFALLKTGFETGNRRAE